MIEYIVKRCYKCSESKPLEDFHSNKSNSDGKTSACKLCNNENAKNWRRKNPNKESERYAKNLEKRLAYYEANKETMQANAKRWRRKNAATSRAHTAAYRASKLQATPKWLTKEHKKEIEEIYKLAKELSWLSEGGLHIDHIFPLRGKNSCGLHVPWNLQIIPRTDNLRKSNRQLEIL